MLPAKQYNKRSCPNNPTHSYIYSYKQSIPIIILFESCLLLNTICETITQNISNERITQQTLIERVCYQWTKILILNQSHAH
jgi:hypothetical protein